MAEAGVEIAINDEEKDQKGGKLAGQTFVLTGELENFTRDAAKDMIRKSGGSVSSAVSRQTDYLLAGANPGSKYAKAQALGVKIIGEDEFKKLIA